MKILLFILFFLAAIFMCVECSNKSTVLAPTSPEMPKIEQSFPVLVSALTVEADHQIVHMAPDKLNIG